jgi:putative resolvase
VRRRTRAERYAAQAVPSVVGRWCEGDCREHRDRLACFGVEHLAAAVGAQGRRIVVVAPGEASDDLVRDVIEVPTSMCARLYERRGVRNRAMPALMAAKREPGAVA